MFPRKLIFILHFCNICLIIPQNSLSVFTKCLLLENHLIQDLLFIPRQILLPVSWKSRSGFRKTKYQCKPTPAVRGVITYFTCKTRKIILFLLIKFMQLNLNRTLDTVYMQPGKRNFQFHLSLFIYFTLFSFILHLKFNFILSLSIYFPT